MRTEGEKSVWDTKFETELQKQESTAKRVFEKNLTDQIDVSVRKGNDYGTIIEQRLRQRFQRESKKIREEARILRAQQVGELDFASNRKALDEQRIKLEAINARLLIEMELPGGKSGKIETTEELDQFRRVGAEEIQEAITDEHLDIIQRIGKTPEKLEKADAAALAEILRTLMTSAPSKATDLIGIVLVAYLSPQQRYQLMDYMLDEPGIHDMIVDFVKLDRLTVVQAEALFKKAIEETAPHQKKEREALEARITEVKSKETEETQKEVRKIKKKGLRQMKRRQFGHRNRARELFSGKGLLSAALAANGALMVAGNSLANLHSPVDLIMNPYTGIGLALMAGGLEWSDGFAGLAPKPSKGIVALTKKKKEIQKEKEANARTAMMKSFGNSPLAAKLYYQNAEEIVKIYKARKRKNPDGDIRITLKDLGLDYKDKDFQDKYGSAPEQKLINDISHWANYFDTTGLSVRKTSKESQSEFIEQSLDTYGPGHNYLTE